MTCLSVWAAAASVVVSVDRDNEVQIIKDGVQVARNTFFIFPTNSEIVAMSKSVTGTNSTSSVGSYNGVTFTANTSFTSDSTGMTLTVTAVPSADITISRAFVSVQLPDTAWADGSGQIGLANVSFPRNFGALTLYYGSAAQSQLSRPDNFAMTVSTQTTQMVEVQDSRQWMPYFELRVGIVGGLWRGGQTKTWQLRFTTSAGTPVLDQPFVVGGANWVAVQPSLDVLAGSALDLTPSVVTAAGAKGWLKVSSAGKFVFESDPNTPQRFYGANLVGDSLFGTHAMADQLATRLQRLGYNMVRIHHYDSFLVKQGLSNSTTIDPVQLEKLNYLVYALKKRGIYVAIDLYSVRQILPNEIFPGTVDMNDFKMLYQISQAARQNLLTFATNLLNSNNSYTGLMWKDDPAIAWIDMVNEDGTEWIPGWVRPEVRQAMNAAYLNSGGLGVWDPTTDAGAKFAAQKNLEAYNWMKQQLRGIGVKALLTDNNCVTHTAMNLVRNQSDFVDSHYYWDHPVFLNNNWTVPFTQSAKSQLDDVDSLGWLSLSRIANKPFTVSELDMVAPNPCRAEFGLLVGSVAGAQDWDGMTRYSYAHSRDRLASPQPVSSFDLATDPLNMATERAIVMLYLRKHLQLNLPKATWLVDPTQIGAKAMSAPMEKAVFSYALSSSLTQGDPTGASPIADSGIDQTPDGKVVADAFNKTFTVNTPLTCGLVAGAGKTVTAGVLKGAVSGSRAVVWASSLDNRSLSTSRRILVTHLTDLQNTGATFSGQARQEMTSWGTLPYLALDGTVAVTLQMQDTSRLRVYRLDMTGKRIAQVSFSKSAGAITFNATVRGPNGATFYYEITR
jgi:hypothetical protein